MLVTRRQIIAIMMLLLRKLRVEATSSTVVGFITKSPALAKPSVDHFHYLNHHRHMSSTSAALFFTSSPMSWEMITNQSSKTVKLFKSIHKNKSKRNESGFTVAEGVRLVTDILSDEKSRKLVRRIIVSESLINGQNSNEYQQQLEHLLNVVEMESRQSKAQFASGSRTEDSIDPVTINIGTDQVLAACSGTVTTQGVVALMEIPQSLDASIVARTANESNKPPFYVILDGLQDPGNVGTILRSCAASHVSALVLLPDSCDVWNPKAVRSAMGASFRVPVIELKEKDGALDKMLHMLDSCGIESDRVFAATMEDTGDGRASIAHYDVDFDKGAAIILGKEGEGLREEVRNAMAQGVISTVHIPMAQGTESLNAAVCGSIIMFERMRQLSATQSASAN
jgi:tRNA G18 (ribose-2'-O)-methylase SpoU